MLKKYMKMPSVDGDFYIIHKKIKPQPDKFCVDIIDGMVRPDSLWIGNKKILKPLELENGKFEVWVKDKRLMAYVVNSIAVVDSKGIWHYQIVIKTKEIKWDSKIINPSEQAEDSETVEQVKATSQETLE